MNSPRVEQAALSDIPRLEKLFGCNAQPEGIRFLLEHPSHGRICVARQGETIAAAACLVTTISTAEGGFVLWLEDIATDPAYIGQGLEPLLLDYALDYARKNGFLRITVLPEKMPPETHGFFRDRGFEHSGMIPLRLSTQR